MNLQDGDDQKDLVQFFYVVSVLIVVYIGAVYFGKDSATGLYALFHYKHESVGEAMDMPFSAVSSAEGFVRSGVVRTPRTSSGTARSICNAAAESRRDAGRRHQAPRPVRRRAGTRARSALRRTSPPLFGRIVTLAYGQLMGGIIRGTSFGLGRVCRTTR